MSEEDERSRYRDEWEDREWERDGRYGYPFAGRGPYLPPGYDLGARPIRRAEHVMPTQESRGHRGKGPAGYQRSDERIREAVCEILTEDDRVDATHIDVVVHGGEVTLSGTVEDRAQKRHAEDLVESVIGVKDVLNHIRIGSDHDRKK